MKKLCVLVKKIGKLLDTFAQKLNLLYIAIITIIAIGIGLLIASYWIENPDIKNIAVGLGTGIVTSALVTLYIEIINGQIQRKKLLKYKNMLLNPLFNAVKLLYIQVILSVNEYRIKEEIQSNIFLPMDDTKELSDFFNEMKKIDIGNIENGKKKKHLEEFSYISPTYFKEVISQFEGLPLDSLLLELIITQDEYDILKHFSLVNEGKRCLNALNEREISEQELYCVRVQLLHSMLLFINRLMKIFGFIAKKMEYENEWIREHLSDVYYNEVYVFSDKYIEEQCERSEAEAEYYAVHPELLEEAEENEEDQLYRKINEAIWAGNVDTIIECFPQIDKDNKQIQSGLTWSVAKNVMKNKELRELYYKKYGVKYKIRRERKIKK